ncbi:MAG TPA: RNA polymerase sigma-70 factor [Flavisolibacter sp.]|nr:RNA polymerase sigma-70 factor [Flavisolibacter sp.]
MADGDQRAFSMLVDGYGAAVYAHVLTYLKNASRAEEITQDIFLNIWNHRDELPSLQNFRGYLFVLTRNRTISAFREKMMKFEEAEKDELQTALNPCSQLEYRQLSDTVQRGISQLPERRRQVFTMSRFDGKTYDEIATHLNISKSAVNKHIIESLVFLRTYLRNEMVFLLLFFLLSELF